MAKITVYDTTTGAALQMRAVDAIVARRRGKVRFRPLAQLEPDMPKPKRVYKRRDMMAEDFTAPTPDDAA